LLAGAISSARPARQANNTAFFTSLRQARTDGVRILSAFERTAFARARGVINWPPHHPGRPARASNQTP
jgi:hypothetical protein